MEALSSEAASRVLGQPLVRELLYRALCDPEAVGSLHGLLLGSKARAQIHRILQRLHTDCAKPLGLSDLAQEAGMSCLALHHQFETVTRTSRVQYLKTLRLHKARSSGAYFPPRMRSVFAPHSALLIRST